MAAHKKEKAEKADEAPEAQDKPKTKAKQHPLFQFFGPECEPEIQADGTMTRGAETFYAAPEGESIPGTPNGDWQGMAERNGVILYRLHQ